MKKYLLTSPAYTGEAELTYNNENVLQIIDCSNTNMTVVMIDFFKKQAPVIDENIKGCFSNKTVIVSTEININFEQFWIKYDYKVHKERAAQLFERLSKTNKVLAFYGLDAYHKMLRFKPGQDKQHPDTYLRTKGWLNEYKF